MAIANLAENATGIAEVAGEGAQALAGNWTLLIGAIVLIVAAFFVIYVFKQLIANAIAGIIALLVIKYFLGIPIPLSPLVILISILGGLGGVGAVLIASFMGWLPEI